MKKILSLMFSLVFFVGCQFGGNKDAIETKTPEDPQAAFNMLTEKHRTAWKESILELLPEIQSYEKTKTDFSLKATATVPELGGDLNVTLESKSFTDASKPDSPNMKSDITLSGDLQGTSLSGNAKALLSIVIFESSLYASLKDLVVDIPNIPTSEILAPVQPIIGNWYGDRFTTISESMGGGIDLQKILTQNAKGPAELRKKIGNIIQNTKPFTMKNRLPSEGGYDRFEVELNKTEIKKAVLDFAKISNQSEEALQQIGSDFDANMAGVQLTGTLGIQTSDPKYITFSGSLMNSEKTEDDININISTAEEKKTISVTGKGENHEHASLEIISKGNTDTFKVSGGETEEENEMLISGQKSDSSFALTLFDPERKKEVANIMLEKAGNVWKGKVTNTESPEIVVFIDHLEFNETSFLLKLTVNNEDKKIGNGSIDFLISEVNSVDISAPESFEPFGKMLEKFLPLMSFGNAGLSPTGTLPPGAGFPPPPEDMTDEEFQVMMEELMKEEGVNLEAGLEEIEEKILEKEVGVQ